MTSYNNPLEITGCESIETTSRTKRRLWAEALIRMSGVQVPKLLVFGNFGGWSAERTGSERKMVD